MVYHVAVGSSEIVVVVVVAAWTLHSRGHNLPTSSSNWVAVDKFKKSKIIQSELTISF